MADEIKLKAPTVEQQVVVNIQGEEKLRSFADTLEKISNNKNLQKYWKTQQELINATADAYGNFSKKASQDNAKELIKVTNALKAMSGTDLSNILPDFDKISKAMAEAQKVAGNIDSAFSVKGFKEAFDSFETLKAYGVDIQNLFSHFGVSSDVGELQKNVRSLEGEVEKLTRRLINAKNANEELRNEFENFKSGSGFADKLDELDNLKSEMSYLREQAEETFRQFLKLNNITEDGYDRDGFYDDNRFKEYFQNIQSGYMSASDAIRQFKTEYSYLLEDSFKSNNDTFGLEQLQAFSNKLDSIFRQVEETSTKINDIISNGVITKSVENLSMDSSLSDSQRSLFGNLLKDEESLKSITALFQKLIEESNKTSKVDLFNDEQLQQVLSIFDKMEGHLSSLRSIISDVGDGEEFSPLLKALNDIKEAASNIKLNFNMDLGDEVSERLNQKVSQASARQLEAYRNLLSAMKGTGKTNKEMFQFFEPDDASVTELIGIYKGIIERAEKQFKVGNSNIYKKYLGSEYDALKREITNANKQLSRSDSKRSENGILGDLFGNNKDLSGVIEQLNIIVSKLDEISVSAKGLTEALKNGLNINASVEEIEKLTNRVKELESELAKIKTPTTIPSKDMKDAFPDKDVYASVESATNSIKEENNVLEQNTQKVKENTQAKEQNANVNFNKYDKRLDSYNGKIDKYKTTIDRFNDGGWTSDTYLKNVQAVRDAVKQYKTLLNELKGKDASLVTSDDISKLDEYEKKIKDTIATVTNMSAAEKGYNFVSGQKELDKIHKLLNENSKMSSEAKAKIKAYYAQIESGNPSMSLDKIHGEIMKIYNADVEAGRAGRSFFDTLKNSGFHQLAAQMAGMFGVYDVINIFKQGANTLKEFDDGLTKISYTMDMTKSQLDNLGNSVLDMASNMKSSIDDAMQVAQIYANMQTSAEEIQRLSEPTLILSNLSGFDSSTIADDIQAVTQQFDILAEDSMHIADVYDYISRNIEVDYSKGLNAMAEGLQVAGSTAKQAGLSYEQTASIIAKAVEKTRLEGSQVGNGLKTIMTRLSKVGELSEEVDNETLSQASESLKKVGIEVYNLDGSYREFDVIMGELAGKWDDLTDAEKSNISFNIAATRQTNLLSAVLSNFSDSMQLAEEATNANGSALENQQKYMESFSGHLQSLETEAKIAWLNILDSETLKDGVDLLTGLVKVTGQLVDTFGLLGTAAGIGGIVAGFKNVGIDTLVAY